MTPAEEYPAARHLMIGVASAVAGIGCSESMESRGWAQSTSQGDRLANRQGKWPGSTRVAVFAAPSYDTHMDRKLPFVGRIFWKVLVVVAVLAVVAWFLVLRLTEYKMTSADWGGSIISGILLAYLIHLWLLPQPAPPAEDDAPPSEPEQPPAEDDR